MSDPALLSALCSLLSAILGAALASFIHCAAWRWVKGESVVVGRSKCDNCQCELCAADLIPIVSYLQLHGQCRNCGSVIAKSTVITELVGAVLFIAITSTVVAATGLSLLSLIHIIFGWSFVCCLGYLALCDHFSMHLPARFAPAAALVFAGSSLLLGRPFFDVVLGISLGVGIFAIQYLLSRGKWVGVGDIGIGALLGAALGFKTSIVALFVAYVIGAFYAAWLLLSKRAGRGERVPFVPFLAIGGCTALLIGERLVNWYLGLLS